MEPSPPTQRGTRNAERGTRNPELVWPPSSEVHGAVAERLTRLLGEHGGLVAEIGRRTLSSGTGVLSQRPHSLTSVLVPGTCLSAGAPWQQATWPAVAAECMMAAADLFDDVADADPGSPTETSGVLLTAAAGLLSLAGAAVVRVVDDGAPPGTAVALADLLGTEFANAANGQAANLKTGDQDVDALTAFRQAAAKSGPLGSLMARLGARTATDDARMVDLLGQFGRHLAVRSQLLNDARDVGSTTKADVRAGARTVPLVFTGSTGAPAGLNETQLAAWEAQERARVVAGGGLAAAHALAEAERLGALNALEALERLGCPVSGLRALVS
jgi:geranylgeranyl pyrophosphate synthase